MALTVEEMIMLSKVRTEHDQRVQKWYDALDAETRAALAMPEVRRVLRAVLRLSAFDLAALERRMKREAAAS